MGVVVREVLTGDRAAVARMLQSSGAFTADEIHVALELFDDAVKGAGRDYIGFTAVADAQVYGYVCLGPTPLTSSTWHLYWICVDVGAQGTGVGRALQSHAEAVVRMGGGERLVLETSSQPRYARARRFYEAAGYREVGRIANFYKAGDDCVIYFKELTAGASRSK
jgi:ribosomal protein S18 acetylase RimI-like enzyme